MTTKKILLPLALGISLLGTAATADDAKARAIMTKVDAREKGQTLQQDLLMVLVDQKGNKRKRDMTSSRKYYGKDERKIMFFKSPADVRNTAFLTYDYDKASKDDDQWLYLPALKKVKRIPGSDKSSSFMGSDFSYSDMTKMSLSDYSFKLLKDSKVRGHAVWVIEATPRSKKVMKETGYTKLIDMVRKDNNIVVRSIGYMRGGKKKYLDIPRMHKQSGIWVLDELSMTTKKGKKTIHKTILKYSKTKINKPISDKEFTTRRLEKGL